jgi:hypothetical protein
LSAAAPRSQDTADAPASKPAAKASERSRSLTVRSTPAGALVTVDGREYGRTPLTIRELATGTHRVRVTRDGYATQSRRVVIARSQPSRSIALTLPRLNAARVSTPVPESSSTIGRYTAALSIDSRPSGAKVFIDGRAAGVTPLSLSDFAAGEHAIRLEHSGYRGWSSSVRVVANERNRVTASLEK